MVPDQAGLADLELVVVLEPLLGLQREHHRRREPGRHLQHLGARLTRSLAHEQGHGPGLVEHRRRLLHDVGCRHAARALVDVARRRRALGQLEPAHVAGQGQHGHTGVLQGGVARLLDQQRQLVDAGHGAVEDRHVVEEPVVVDLLEELAAHLLARHLAADGQHGGVRLLGVVEPVEQVDGTRSHRPHAHGEAPGQLRLRAGREGTDLLVAYADPLDAVLAADRVGDRVEGVADHAPDGLHAVLGQGIDQQLGNGGQEVLLRGEGRDLVRE